MVFETFLLTASTFLLLLILIVESEAYYQRKWISLNNKRMMDGYTDQLVKSLCEQIVGDKKELILRIDRIENLMKEQNSHVFVADSWEKFSRKV